MSTAASWPGQRGSLSSRDGVAESMRALSRLVANAVAGAARTRTS
jgi:hypothetical protein